MIAMFDSGLGGLSVWRAITRALPTWPVTYLADQAHVPYGSKSQQALTQRSLRIGNFLQQQGADLLVVACNTATSAAVDVLRHTLPIPIVAIEPAVKPAAQASRTGQIAVLATEFMLQSARFHALVQRHAGEVKVLTQPGHGWVELVEAGELDGSIAQAKVAAVITPLLAHNIDHIVLGCTHYPFLAPLIHHMTGSDIILDDPADAVARRVTDLLTEKTAPRTTDYHFYTTGAPAPMSKVLPLLIGQSCLAQHIDL